MVRVQPGSTDVACIQSIRLFDDVVRTDMARANRLEAKYGWWNRSARPEIARVRDALEKWFAAYPSAESETLSKRFRSKTSETHDSALFELYVHEQLRKAGYRVSCHPSVENSRCTPDFLAQREGGLDLYVEAVLAGPSAEAKAKARLKDAVTEAVDSFQSTHFAVSMKLKGTPTSYPRVRHLKNEIQKWLGAVEREILAATNAPALPSQFVWNAVGLRLQLTPILMPAREGKRRLLAFQSGEMFCEPSDHPWITRAVTKKPKRYGVLNLPYLIAINVLDLPLSRGAVLHALQKGWGTKSKPKNRRVSGVLLATIWNPLSAVARDLVYVANPNAFRPLDPGRLGFSPLGETLEQG